MNRNGVTTVVFDIGGVLVDWNPRYLYRKLLDDKALDRFLEEVCTTEWHQAHDRGVPMAQTATQLRNRYPDLGGLIDAWNMRWPEMFGGPVAGTVRLMERLVRRHIPVHGLTNWPAEKFDEAVVMFPFLAHLDPTVVSGREGIAKPDLAIFQMLIDRTDLVPDSTLYIDDADANVAAAADMGFVTHHFQSAEALERDLTRLALL